MINCTRADPSLFQVTRLCATAAESLIDLPPGTDGQARGAQLAKTNKVARAREPN